MNCKICSDTKVVTSLGGGVSPCPFCSPVLNEKEEKPEENYASKQYPFAEIEAKYRKEWEEKGTYKFKW